MVQSKSYVFIWELSNSIASGQTGAQAYTSMSSLCQAIKIQFPNTKTIVMTMLPRGASTTVESERLLVNTAVMVGTSSTGVTNFYSKGTDNIDYVYDVAAISTIGAPNSQSNTTNYLADTIHLNTTGGGYVRDGAVPIINFLGAL